MDVNKNDFNKERIEREKFILIGQMMSGLMHNLNTPLTGSAGQLMLSDRKLHKVIKNIKDKASSDEEIIGLINESINHNGNIRDYLFYMSDVIDAVKTYIKSSDSYNVSSFTISELFEKVKLLVSFTLKKNKIECNFKIKDGLEMSSIKGELNSLIQVIINLIDNSIASYNNNIGKINVIAKKGEDNFIKIIIEDFGSGIKDEIKSKIFKEMVTTKGNKGTGIGLYMSNVIMKENFNGTMDIETKFGKGTRVELSLKSNI
jgi:signal transduction histidine kinase